MNKFYLEQAAKLLSPALYYSQLHRLTKPVYSGLGQILMFHRVVPISHKLRIHNHKSLEVSPEYLENLIAFFKKEKYQFLSLDEMLEFGKHPKPKQKFVVFTFDDGYVDNLKYAYPIFKRHNIPFTIYVATNLPDGNAVVWWYLLEEVIVENPEVTFTSKGKAYSFTTQTVKQKEMAFNKIRSMLAIADETELTGLVESLFANQKDILVAKTKELALSWDEIRQLSNESLVTIGSHTISHLPLNSLSMERSRQEILDSKDIIEKQLSKEVKHFCYPLGSYGDKEVEILKSTTYHTATTIKMANLYSENFQHPFTLPRIMINSLTNERILKLQVSGLLPALRNRFKRVVI
jgi:peptidoglycan/xylan/chitin deacetylase (PgdA/CDA1 family)